MDSKLANENELYFAGINKDGDREMNIYEAVERIIEAQDEFWILPEQGQDSIKYKQAIADILQELLDTNGVGSEYMEVDDLVRDNLEDKDDS